jgi:hypothetical protein
MDGSLCVRLKIVYVSAILHRPITRGEICIEDRPSRKHILTSIMLTSNTPIPPQNSVLAAIELTSVRPGQSDIAPVTPQNISPPQTAAQPSPSTSTRASTSDSRTSRWNVKFGLYLTAFGVLLATVVLYPTWEGWVLAKHSITAADWANAAIYRADCQSRKVSTVIIQDIRSIRIRQTNTNYLSRTTMKLLTQAA